MNIGIDAKWFFKGNPSGRVVIQNLLKEFLSIDKSNQYFIFLRKEDAGKKFPFIQDNVHLVYIWSKNNMLSNFFVTPYYAYKFKIDVFLYQYFGPIIKYSKVITLIHDVIFESNPEYFSIKERVYFKPMRFLARHADKIVTISRNEKNRLIKFNYANSEKINVIHLGVSEVYSKNTFLKESTIESIKSKYKLPENFVLYVGRLNYRKNIHNLIKAFQFVEDNELKLVLAGGYDWKMFDVKKFITEQNLNDKVQVLGFVDDNELPYLYKLSTLFCFISFDEGFGLPPLEAMATGTPVIVADRGSLPEVCGGAGIYVDPNDPKKIGETINSIYSNESLRDDLAKKSINQAVLFNWKNTAKKYLDLFNRVVSE